MEVALPAQITVGLFDVAGKMMRQKVWFKRRSDCRLRWASGLEAQRNQAVLWDPVDFGYWCD